MRQHLGFSVAAQLRSNLKKKYSLTPEKCSFRLVAYGPILEEEPKESFRERRDIIAALEKALAEAMKGSGYDVMNKVNGRMPEQTEPFKEVRAAFAKQFPKLKGKPL